jgi:hypothetical protein
MSSVRKKSTAVRQVTYAAVAAALLGLPSLALADEVFVLKQTVNIPGNPFVSGDISFVDPLLDKYFFADRSNSAIDVIDTNTKAISQLKESFAGFTGNNNTSGPNGVLTVHREGDHDHDFDDRHKTEVWAGDGPQNGGGPSFTSLCPGAGVFTTACSTVKVLDLAGNVLHDIPTGGANRADELCYDPVDHLITIANDADTPPFISFIPTEGPNAYHVVKQLKFPEATNGIEQCQWDPRTRLIYQNIPEVNGPGNDTQPGNVYVIDPHSLSVITKWVVPIADCAGPQGMAIGPAPQILLGCNAPSIPSNVRNSLVISEETGKPIATLANEGGADEVWFNPGDGHYFLGDSALTPNRIIGVVDSRTDAPDQDIIIASATPATNKGSHSVAADQERNQAYVPIPNNAGSTICPTPSIGCIAIFGPKGRDDAPVFVFRDHD